MFITLITLCLIINLIGSFIFDRRLSKIEKITAMLARKEMKESLEMLIKHLGEKKIKKNNK